MAITIRRRTCSATAAPWRSAFIAETVERVAFLAREDKRIDKRSEVSQRMPISALESAVSNAERLRTGYRGNSHHPPHRGRVRRPALDHRQDGAGVRRGAKEPIPSRTT